MFLKSSELYDLFYEGKDYAAEAQMLHRLIAKHKHSEGMTLLDVACGTGKHIEYLKRLYLTEGFDLNEKLLEKARERNSDVTFHQADMLSFNFNKQYDVITCLFSAIGYAKTPDNLKLAIASMKHHLKPGGVILLEPWFDKQSYIPGMAHAIYIDKPGIKACRMNVSEIEKELSVIVFHYLIAEEGGNVEHFTERHEIGLFSRDQYIQAFRNCGLEVSYDQRGLTGRGLYIAVPAQAPSES